MFTVPPAVPFLYYMRSVRLLRIFFLKLGLFAGFSLEQRSCDGRAGEIIYFKVQRSSFRVQQSSFRVLRSSEGCSVSPKGAA